MPIPVTNPPWALPPYTYRGGPLPKSGPDRVRFAFGYEKAFAESGDHELAVECARGQLRLLHILVRTLGVRRVRRIIGDFAMGVHVDAQGDDPCLMPTAYAQLCEQPGTNSVS